MTIGPDGKYPYGAPLKDGDHGGLNVKFSVQKEMRLLSMEFGTSLSWIAQKPNECMGVVKAFRDTSMKAFGYMTTDASTFPFVVTANKTNGTVETQFPSLVSTLVANPELFLVWADKMEEAAIELGYETMP